MIDHQPVQTLITIEPVCSKASQRSHAHHTLRQHLLVLLRKITQFNLNMTSSSLTPIELLSRQVLLVLHDADHPLTSHELVQHLHVSTTAIDAGLEALLEDQTIIPYTPTSSPQIHAVEITLEGRIRAQALTSWTDVLVRFIANATPTALGELHQSLLTCLTRRRHTIAIPALCVTCRYFAPFQYLHDPVQPHHCHLMNQPLLDTSLRTTCLEHQISSRS